LHFVGIKVFSAFTSSNPARSPASSINTTPSISTAPNYIDSTASIEQLTEREHEILIQVTQGALNRQIAENLFLAEGTIKNHLSSIFGKLGVRDRTQAALKARELGLA